MSLTTGELENLTNAFADFEEFLAEEKYEDARALVDNLRELGYKNEAMTLGRRLLSVKMSIRPRKPLSLDVRENIDSRIWSSHR